MKPAALLACLMLVGCSMSTEDPKQKQPADNPAPPTTPAESPDPESETPEPTQPSLPDPPVLPTPELNDPGWSVPEEPARPWDENEARIEVEPISPNLLETVTSMYGVRLPRSSSRLSLEAAIGDADWQIDYGHERPGGPHSFVREVIISVSKNEIYLNNTRAVPLVCSTSDGGVCPETFGDSNHDVVYRVDPEHLGKNDDNGYVITSLLKLLNDVQRGRRAVLGDLSEEAAAWLMDCDAYTLIADRAVPYSILAKIIHTAAYADLTRVRLATLDDNDQLTYIPIVAPRLDHAQRKVSHLLGDTWWRAQQRRPDEAFPFAYLSYSASAFPETFGELQGDVLPSCLPLSIAWPKILVDPEYARISTPHIIEYVEEMRTEWSQMLGLAPAPPPPDGLTAPVGVDHSVPAVDDAQGAGSAPEEEPQEAGTIDGYLASRVLVESPADAVGDVVEQPADIAKDGAAAADSAEHAEGISVRPFVFVGPSQYVVALRSPGGSLSRAVAVPRSDPDKLYQYLDAARGWALGVSAQGTLSNEQLVAALDTFRYRCNVHAMSGKCKHWEPVLPHIYFFMVPGDRFSPVPREEQVEPPPEDEPEPAAEEKDPTDGEGAAAQPAATAAPADEPTPEPEPPAADDAAELSAAIPPAAAALLP